VFRAGFSAIPGARSALTAAPAATSCLLASGSHVRERIHPQFLRGMRLHDEFPSDQERKRFLTVLFMTVLPGPLSVN
jgi:hypothetical protein